MKKSLYIIFFIFFSPSLKAKEVGKAFYGNLKNKAELIVIHEERPDLCLSMNIRVAPYIETPSNAGISRLLLYMIYANLVRLDPVYAKTELHFYPDYSTFIFHLENKPYEVERVLSNIYKPILIDSIVFDQAKVLTIKSYTDQLKNMPQEEIDFETKIQQYVWGDYHFKKYQSIEETVLDNINSAMLVEVYKKYFKPSNSLFVLCGNFIPETKFAEVNETTLYEDKVENNYIPIGKTNIYKNLISSSQIALKDTDHVLMNKAVITYQITGNYQNNNGYIKLMILNKLLNQYSNQIFPESKDVFFSLKTEKYAAEISLNYTPTSLHKEEFYTLLRHLNTLSFDSLFTESEYQITLQQIIAENESNQDNASSFENNILLWWNIESLDHYVDFDTTVQSITPADILQSFNKYIRNAPYVFVINNNNLVDPGEENTLQSVDDTSVEGVFYYDYNISDLTRESEKEKLWKILQWLFINPNLTIQVNGYADRNEYLKADATELRAFIEQYPQFKVVSSKIGKATWQRLDMVRAIKIAKFLIDNGIDYNRVKGSGLLLDSEDKEGMNNNQKVDFSYQRFRIDQN